MNRLPAGGGGGPSLVVLLLGALCVVASVPDRRVSAQESPTLAAMQDEMKRSMAELRMKGEAGPYFIAYEVLDRSTMDVSGRLGALVENPLAARVPFASKCEWAITTSTARDSSSRVSAEVPA